jgi:hypothetical protein
MKNICHFNARPAMLNWKRFASYQAPRCYPAVSMSVEDDESEAGSLPVIQKGRPLQAALFL